MGQLITFEQFKDEAFGGGQYTPFEIPILLRMAKAYYEKKSGAKVATLKKESHNFALWNNASTFAQLALLSAYELKKNAADMKTYGNGVYVIVRATGLHDLKNWLTTLEKGISLLKEADNSQGDGKYGYTEFKKFVAMDSTHMILSSGTSRETILPEFQKRVTDWKTWLEVLLNITTSKEMRPIRHLFRNTFDGQFMANHEIEGKWGYNKVFFTMLVMMTIDIAPGDITIKNLQRFCDITSEDPKAWHESMLKKIEAAKETNPLMVRIWEHEETQIFVNFIVAFEGYDLLTAATYTAIPDKEQKVARKIQTMFTEVGITPGICDYIAHHYLPKTQLGSVAAGREDPMLAVINTKIREMAQIMVIEFVKLHRDITYLFDEATVKYVLWTKDEEASEILRIFHPDLTEECMSRDEDLQPEDGTWGFKAGDFGNDIADQIELVFKELFHSMDIKTIRDWINACLTKGFDIPELAPDTARIAIATLFKPVEVHTSLMDYVLDLPETPLIFPDGSARFIEKTAKSRLTGIVTELVNVQAEKKRIEKNDQRADLESVKIDIKVDTSMVNVQAEKKRIEKNDQRADLESVKIDIKVDTSMVKVNDLFFN